MSQDHYAAHKRLDKSVKLGLKNDNFDLEKVLKKSEILSAKKSGNPEYTKLSNIQQFTDINNVVEHLLSNCHYFISKLSA